MCSFFSFLLFFFFSKTLFDAFAFFYSGVEHGDEIYSLCQVPPVVCKQPAIRDLSPPPSSNKPAVKKPSSSSTEKVFRPKCLVDSNTFLLPAGDGPVYLDIKTEPKVAAATTPVAKVAATTSTANVFKKKPVCSESPKATTANIFAPRTEDMNKGFLTFSDDDTGLTSKAFVYYYLLLILLSLII